MSNIEKLVLSAEEHGKRSDLLKEVSRLRELSPNEYLDSIYERAYSNVLNT